MIILLMAAILSINLESYTDPEWSASWDPFYPIITDIAVWDYDSDGNTEIAFTTYSLDDNMYSTGHVYVVQFNGFSLEREFVSSESNSYQACLWFDYDEDGDYDLLVSSSVTISMDGYVGVYENTEGNLSNTMILVATETQWDPLDLALGDFNHDNVLDILVMCADRHPQILRGYYDYTGAYKINQEPVLLSFTSPSTGSVPPAFYRASIADVNGDNIVDVLVTKENYLAELLSYDNCYSLSPVSGKQIGIWISCAYGPPVSSAPSNFTMLVGAAWDNGMGFVFQRPEAEASGHIVDPDLLLIEYVSDISAVYTEANDPGQYYLSLSECGLLGREPEDTRSRHCRVNCWNYSAAGGVYSTVYFADPLQRPRKPEAFCTEWASIDTSEQFEMTFSFSIENSSQRLFLISDIDGVGFENNFRVKLGITESEIQRGFQLIDAKVQYIENGLIYLTTPPQTGDVLSVTFLTTNNPCPVFGRRGVLELYEIF